MQPSWLSTFNSVSTTNLKIYFTLFVILGTAVRYWITGTPPDNMWLYFLGTLAGIDTAQFYSKRATYKPELANGKKEEDVTKTTDIQELSQQKGQVVMCYVEVRRSDDKRDNIGYVDAALKELKRKMKKENVLIDLKKKEHHVPPSAKKRLKRQEAIKRLKREENKAKWSKSNKN